MPSASSSRIPARPESESVPITGFARLAETLEQAAATRGRGDRVRGIGELLRALDPAEIRPAVSLMLGRGSGAKSGISWAALASAVKDAFGSPELPPMDGSEGFVDAGVWTQRVALAAGLPAGGGLSIGDVADAFVAIAAARGRREKERRLADLLRSVTPSEAAWIARNAVGEMRAGAQEGLLLEAIARASGRPIEVIRRALVAAGDVVAVAEAALLDEGRGLEDLEIQIGRPIPPMLADSADGLASAFERLRGDLALEWKLDGARIQIHRDGDRVRLWSRRLTDVTERLPDVVGQVREGLAADRAIVEGEMIVHGPDGRPIPFQDVMRRWLRRTGAEDAAASAPASIFLFDCLYLDDRAIVDQPYVDRWRALERVRGALATVPRLTFEGAVTQTVAEQAREFYQSAIAAGHEGVMAKSLQAPYAPGHRGSHWMKVKAESRLDLVVVGADWGTGRRHRWLSNYHLACRDPETGRYLSVGETFKGLTDAEFAWMTRELLERKIEQRGGYVAVRPEIVVEVLFNGVQRSTRLPSGVALRFARITRIREDKPPQEADTLPTLKALLVSPS